MNYGGALAGPTEASNTETAKTPWFDSVYVQSFSFLY